MQILNIRKIIAILFGMAMIAFTVVTVAQNSIPTARPQHMAQEGTPVPLLSTTVLDNSMALDASAPFNIFNDTSLPPDTENGTTPSITQPESPAREEGSAPMPSASNATDDSTAIDTSDPFSVFNKTSLPFDTENGTTVLTGHSAAEATGGYESEMTPAECMEYVRSGNTIEIYPLADLTKIIGNFKRVRVELEILLNDEIDLSLTPDMEYRATELRRIFKIKRAPKSLSLMDAIRSLDLGRAFSPSRNLQFFYNAITPPKPAKYACSEEEFENSVHIIRSSLEFFKCLRAIRLSRTWHARINRLTGAELEHRLELSVGMGREDNADASIGLYIYMMVDEYISLVNLMNRTIEMSSKFSTWKQQGLHAHFCKIAIFTGKNLIFVKNVMAEMSSE